MPCTSTSRSGDVPARRCRPSTFWVTTETTFPRVRAPRWRDAGRSAARADRSPTSPACSPSTQPAPLPTRGTPRSTRAGGASRHRPGRGNPGCRWRSTRRPRKKPGSMGRAQPFDQAWVDHGSLYHPEGAGPVYPAFNVNTRRENTRDALAEEVVMRRSFWRSSRQS